MADPQSASPSSSSSPAVLELAGLGKAFGGQHALDGVDLRIRGGAIHALVGENGAGKSTLINCATGVIRPDAGEIRIDGQAVHLADPRAAARRGIHALHQEADFFPELSLAENMLLERGLLRTPAGLVNWEATYRRAESDLAALELALPVRAAARRLGVGQRVLAMLAAAVAARSRVLFLDEPTASLSGHDSERLFGHLRRLRAAGVAIVYVSHRLEEVLALADEVTVLRDGRKVAEGPTAAFTRAALVAAMVGREIEETAPEPLAGDLPVVLEARGLADAGGAFDGIDLELRGGEIVGLYGLVGAGRSEVAQALFGLRPAARGEVRLHGRPGRARSADEAIRSGLALLPEDRLGQAIFAGHSCRSNVWAARTGREGRLGFLSPATERRRMAEIVRAFAVKLRSPEQAIVTLSGGNQQKLILGRWLETCPDVLLLDEPTRGVDIGAKIEMHRLIREQARQGKAVLLVSSDLHEIHTLSDRTLVMAGGRLAGEFPAGASSNLLADAAFPRETPARPAPAAAPPPGGFFPAFSQQAGLLAAIALLMLIGGLFRPDEFLTFKNGLDVLAAASIVAVIAGGMALVLISGGIDVSVGSMLGLIAACAGMAAAGGWPAPAVFALAILMGAAAGTANALLSFWGRVHPIVVTLAGIHLYRGAMHQVTGGYEVSHFPESFRAWVAGDLGGVPKILLYAAPLAAVHSLLLGRTLLGRRLLATGSSPRAAAFIGIRPAVYQTVSFAILGSLVGLAAVLWAGYYGKVQSNAGAGLELQAIAAAVIGGCSVLGGRGSAWGAFLGAVLIALMDNVLVLLRVSSLWQDVAVGILLLGAVLADPWRSREKPR